MKGCGLKIGVFNGKSMLCGEEFLGKKRYCVRCSGEDYAILVNNVDEVKDEICKCGHSTNDHSYNPNDLMNNNLKCDICDCENFIEGKK